VAGSEVVHTTVNDFSPVCAVADNVFVSSIGGGSVMLAGMLSDGFSAALDGARWATGSWSGGAFTPGLSNGVLTIAGSTNGWVRSNASFTHGELEAVAQFGAGASQHIGFGSNGFEGNRYLIFSTWGGDGNLYARVNNNASEQRVNLGALPVGSHRYRVEWAAADATTDRVRFLVDGVQQAEIAMASAGATGFYVYISNNGSAALSVDAIQVIPPYVPAGTYTSCVLDAGSGSAWQTLTWNATVVADTALTLQTRTSADMTTWTPWSTVAASGSPIIAPARYVQYSALFSTANTQVSPQLDAVTASSSGVSGAGVDSNQPIQDATAEVSIQLFLPFMQK